MIETALNYLKGKVASLSSNLNSELFNLNMLAKVDISFMPRQSDLPYSDVIVVAQTTGPGSCYCFQENPDSNFYLSLLGKDAREVISNSYATNIAILDAIYSNFKIIPQESYQLQGNANQKAESRALIINSEVDRIVRQFHIQNPTISLIGSVGNILSQLTKKYKNIYSTDLDTSLIGQNICGIEIEDGNIFSNKRISQSDIAIVTGMTFSTRTFDTILELANKNDVKILMFCQTGSNFAPFLLELGVTGVISELFPFYMFPGITTVKIYRSFDKS